jgi:hypothetical protein
VIAGSEWMGIFFEPYSSECCCLCGSAESLTGEHKIKASALRAIFGADPMVIGHFDGESDARPAQGPKSRAFHFSAPVCGTCNSDRTQGPDKEFDRFHKDAFKLMVAGTAPVQALELDRYRFGLEPYLNVFRYLAKLMSCHIAESGGPRSIQISDFASGKSQHNPVKLYIDTDPTYQEYSSATGEHGYAAHGGLVVKFSKTTELPTGFHSTLTLGPLRYIFFVEFGTIIGLALKIFHPAFYAKCDAAFRVSLREPIPDHKLKQLGL